MSPPSADQSHKSQQESFPAAMNVCAGVITRADGVEFRLSTSKYAVIPTGFPFKDSVLISRGAVVVPAARRRRGGSGEGSAINPRLRSILSLIRELIGMPSGVALSLSTRAADAG